MEIYMLVLINLGLLVQGEKKGKELDLNFLQNDYHITFERMELVRYNSDFLENVSMVTFKYNRSTAVVNATGTLKVDIGYNLVGITQAYKFMSNEYRHFPIRFAANSCKSLSSNVAGLGEYSKCGNFPGCPMRKGRYYTCNWFPNPSKFPPLIPNGQYKLEVQFLVGSEEIGILNAYGTVSRPIVHN